MSISSGVKTKPSYYWVHRNSKEKDRYESVVKKNGGKGVKIGVKIGVLRQCVQYCNEANIIKVASKVNKWRYTVE